MSFNNATLGQVSTIAQSEPADMPLLERVQRQYGDLRAACIERFGEDFCNSVMPESVFYALQRDQFEKKTSAVPFWAWFLAGFLASKILRI